MLNVFLKSCDFQGWSYSEIYNFTISGIQTSAATPPNFFVKCNSVLPFLWRLDMMSIIFGEAEN